MPDDLIPLTGGVRPLLTASMAGRAGQAAAAMARMIARLPDSAIGTVSIIPAFDPAQKP